MNLQKVKRIHCRLFQQIILMTFLFRLNKIVMFFAYISSVSAFDEF